MILPGKIISGGQTGVDRAALDFAKERGIERSGWAPKGWKAEGGTIPEEHRAFMRETVSADYWPRTVFNVNNSTATLIVYDSRSPMSPGTTKTSHYAGGLIDADGRSIRSSSSRRALSQRSSEWPIRFTSC